MPDTDDPVDCHNRVDCEYPGKVTDLGKGRRRECRLREEEVLDALLDGP
jgi:hypothetical protein